MVVDLASADLLGRRRRPARQRLTHIPGDRGWPVLGHTVQALRDPKAFVASRAARYGLIYRRHMFGEEGVTLLGPEANELVLFDTARVFSSALGWGRMLDRLFPRGLMLLDFDEHRLHRRALSVAFKAGPMRAYRVALNRGIAAALDGWGDAPGEMRFYPAIKSLTLDLAATVFLGADETSETESLQRAFIDMVAASIAVVRWPLPGTAMARGVRGREAVAAYFATRVPARRAGAGDDLFSHLCRATYDDGRPLSVADIVNHMSFFMMAAHDTLTSSISSLIHFLARHPEWQERLREEAGRVAGTEGMLDEADLETLIETEMAFKEALRLHPPVPALPRRAVRDIEFRGVLIPAGTVVSIDPLFTHHMREIWDAPERFDPHRFTEAQSAQRHRFAFVPFGGGAHMCLGLHFAYLQAKCFVWHFLRRYRVTLPAAEPSPWRMWPIPKPVDGLPIRLAPI